MRGCEGFSVGLNLIGFVIVSSSSPCSSSLSNKRLHLRHQLWDSKGFGDNLIHARLNGKMNLLASGICRDRNHRYMSLDRSRLLSFSYMSYTRQSIHRRHFKIQKYDREGYGGATESGG
jgi:hypothetical protein